ncbi:MAG TPA: M4 family metallopeptidase [Bacillota bacterium]|nr:M4 family metallopeptidase [Bacillota bacterium]
MKHRKYFLVALLALTLVVSSYPVAFSREAPAGTNHFVVGELTPASTAASEEVFYRYLDSQSTRFGLGTAARNNFRVFHRETRPEGGTFLKFEQTFHGIPIYKSLIKTQIQSNGILHAISGKMIAGLAKYPGLTRTPAVTQSSAIEIAAADLAQNAGAGFQVAQSGLYIYAEDQEPVLAYVVEFRPGTRPSGRFNYVVDALSGRIIRKANGVVYDSITVGSCPGVLNDVKYINIKHEDAKSRYIMDDETRGWVHIHSMYSGGSDFANSMFTSFYRAEDKPAGDAHYFSGMVLDYYKNQPYNRSSYDNNGAALITWSNMGGLYYDNAAWDGYAIVIGTTDGVKYLPFSGSIECMGHEFTHAIYENETQFDDTTDYINEWGAVNEAFADIFGALIENYYNYADPWICDEDVYTPNIAGDGGIRSISNPPSCSFDDYTGTGLKPYPDHYDNYYRGTFDNGGVHINSSIINKAAYLICQGGTHHGYSITGIGPAKTGWLFYRTLCDYVTRRETFNDLYAHTLQKAVDLYGSGSAEWTAVKDAFHAVGLPNTYQPTYGPFGHGSGGNGLRIDESQSFHENNYDVSVNVNGQSMMTVWADLYRNQGGAWVKCGTTHSCTSGLMYWAGVGPGDYKLEIHYIYPSYRTGYCTYTIH